MTDDIVTRLRQGDPICIDGHIYREWANEAADEIERLRIQVAHHETQLKNADVVIDELEADRDEWMRLAYKSIGQE